PERPAPRRKPQISSTAWRKRRSQDPSRDEPYALTLGQVSRPEQKASVKAPAFSRTEPAATSSASSETSKLRSSSLSIYLSVIGFVLLVRQRARKSPGGQEIGKTPPAKKSIKSSAADSVKSTQGL